MIGDAGSRLVSRVRMKSLVEAWRIIRTHNRGDSALFKFNSALASKVVRHYADDLLLLKQRYGIPDRVQPPKVAGLMANAILKYRPLVPISGGQGGIEHSKVNEFLAVYNGLCVCADFQKGGGGVLNALMLRPLFDEWLERFIFLLRERNYTSENLIMVFETLCWVAFPNVMVDSSIIL